MSLIVLFIVLLLIGFLPFFVSLGAGPGGGAWKMLTFALCVICPFGFGFAPLLFGWLLAWVTAMAAHSSARKERAQLKMLALMVAREKGE